MVKFILNAFILQPEKINTGYLDVRMEKMPTYLLLSHTVIQSLHRKKKGH
jgi:hypothetical protein